MHQIASSQMEVLSWHPVLSHSMIKRSRTINQRTTCLINITSRYTIFKFAIIVYYRKIILENKYFIPRMNFNTSQINLLILCKFLWIPLYSSVKCRFLRLLRQSSYHPPKVKWASRAHEIPLIIVQVCFYG